MDPRLAPLADVLHLNTRLLRNSLDGVDDALARQRVVPGTNHLAFLTAHLADARHFLASTLGVPLENPLAAQLQYGKTLDEVGELPPLAELVAAWDRVSAHLADKAPGIGASRLDADSGLRFPVQDRTVLGAVAFLVQHDSYHIGQMAFLRRQLGLQAMSYR
jgi:uncharacterized damage-inducible protein DinB